MITIKLACGKDIVAAAVCLSRASAVTNDFNHPSKGYINYISTDLSAEIMSTQNDDQNSGRQRCAFRQRVFRCIYS